MKKEKNKNAMVIIECHNAFGMPVRYRKKVNEQELTQLRLSRSVELVCIKWL